MRCMRTQASGLVEMLGTMTNLFHPGKAGQNGAVGAMLASRGIESSRRILESDRGFARLYARESGSQLVSREWGSSWELSKIAFKPYACGIVLHRSSTRVSSWAERCQTPRSRPGDQSLTPTHHPDGQA